MRVPSARPNSVVIIERFQTDIRSKRDNRKVAKKLMSSLGTMHCIHNMNERSDDSTHTRTHTRTRISI